MQKPDGVTGDSSGEHPSKSRASRPSEYPQRYRLYIDESGDHVFREVSTPSHRFLCLLGCWFQNSEYVGFHTDLEALKAKYLAHHPDEPVVLHREDMLNARKAFHVFRDLGIRKAWDGDLLQLIARTRFTIVAVVIDKLSLRLKYGDAAVHPYHLGLGFMLQRYAGFLNHTNRTGDVMGEARGGSEDRLLKQSYMHVHDRGARQMKASR